jgi:hypothetical protein
VSDSNAFNRRQLLGLGAAGAIGGAAGYLLGRREPSQDQGESDDNVKPVVADSLATYGWILTVQGGYAWWFKKNGNKTNVLLMALKPNCSCGNHECVDHKMRLIAYKNAVEVTNETTYPSTEQGPVHTWLLEGATSFIKGMAGAGITELTRTDWNQVSDPHGPSEPQEDVLWNDQVWLPERQKAKDNALDYSSTAFLLTDGTLAVTGPVHDQARFGRFVFQVGGRPKKKALTDRLMLSGSATDAIGIKTTAGNIVLKPKGSTLALWIRHEYKLGRTPIRPGDSLPHYKRMFDFVKDSSCTQAQAPIYEKRTDLDGSDTPGDLCPPLPLD